MNAREFFDLVSDMRLAQQMYADNGDKILLECAKELEKRVDNEIERVRVILEKNKGK